MKKVFKQIARKIESAALALSSDKADKKSRQIAIGAALYLIIYYSIWLVLI